MRRRWIRAILIIGMLGVAVTSGYQLFLFEQLIDQELDAERSFSALGWELNGHISELRTNQQAYVAAGQNRLHWMQKVTEQLDTVDISLTTLAQLATAASTVGSLENAQVAINDFARMDKRARDHSDLGQDLMASDLLFTDGPELALIAVTHIDRALKTERDARDTATTAHRKSQGVALAAAMGTSVLVTLLLLPVSARPIEESSGSMGQEDVHVPSDGPLTIIATPTDETVITADISPTLDLQLAAQLCTDLGQLSNTSQLNVILARAAQIFNASGIIVWILDASKNSLRPAVGHGYSETTLARFGSVSCDDDNVTALSFRDAQIHIVPADSSSLGAIAAPIVSMSGCIGVLSMELQGGWELNEDVQATAAILTAQLSTLVVPDTATTATSVEAAQA
tara:strand:+ start:3630 stop:4823 length:1194 start_codon:yes stop_codon:yes gene_type:complete